MDERSFLAMCISKPSLGIESGVAGSAYMKRNCFRMARLHVQCTRGAALQAVGLHLQGYTHGTPSKQSEYPASPIATDMSAGHMGVLAGRCSRDPSRPTDEP